MSMSHCREAIFLEMFAQHVEVNGKAPVYFAGGWVSSNPFTNNDKLQDCVSDNGNDAIFSSDLVV